MGTLLLYICPYFVWARVVVFTENPVFLLGNLTKVKHDMLSTPRCLLL